MDSNVGFHRDGVPLSDQVRRGELLSADCPSREVLKHVTSRWGVLVLIAGADLPFQRSAPEGGWRERKDARTDFAVAGGRWLRDTHCVRRGIAARGLSADAAGRRGRAAGHVVGGLDRGESLAHPECTGSRCLDGSEKAQKCRLKVLAVPPERIRRFICGGSFKCTPMRQLVHLTRRRRKSSM
jgi:hypothetical protein